MSAHKHPPVPPTAALLKSSSPLNSPKQKKQKLKHNQEYPMLPPSISPQTTPAFFVHPRICHPPTSISALLKLNKIKNRTDNEKHDHLSNPSQFCQPQNKTSIPFGYHSLHQPSSHPPGVKSEFLLSHQNSHLHPAQAQSHFNLRMAGSQATVQDGKIAFVRPKNSISATVEEEEGKSPVPPKPSNKTNQLLSHDLANLVQSEIQKMNHTAFVSASTTGSSTPEDVILRRPSPDKSTGSLSQNDTPMQYPCPSTPDTPVTCDAEENDVNRPKVYVLKACVACKNSHVACDINRPCQRCVRLGKGDSCVDAERKKRGRPCSNFKHSSQADGGEYSGSAGSGTDSDASLSSSVSVSSRHLSKSSRLSSAEVGMEVKPHTRMENGVIRVNGCDPELIDIATALLMSSRSQDPSSSPQSDSQAVCQIKPDENLTGCSVVNKADTLIKTEVSMTERPIKLANKKVSPTKNFYLHSPKRKISFESNTNRINSSHMQTLKTDIRSTQ